MSFQYNLFGEDRSTKDIATENKGSQSNGSAGLKREENSEKGPKIYRFNTIKSKAEQNHGSNSNIECGTDVLNLGAMNKFTGKHNYQTGFAHLNKDDMSGGHGCDINTLEESLRYFKLEHHLQMLEVSLEDVRMHRNNQEVMEVHNLLIQGLDKAILKLSKEHHPDKMLNRMGSEEDVLRAQKLQTALNATRKAMNILNKIFLEDIDIDHKFGFYTKLDISSLGNEDEIEGHVFEVLFKIGLMSEIKQRYIIAEIGKFLTESQSCIASYAQDNAQDFDKYLSSSIFRLKQCIRGYNKLLRESKEIEEECKGEKMDNIYSLIRSMRYNCSRQLNHLEQLLKMTDLCSKGSFGIFTCPEYVDDYFVRPFVSYINILLMCNVFQKRDNQSRFKKVKIISDPVFNEQTIFLASPYYLTSYYGGSKLHENQVQTLLGKKRIIHLNSVKEKFLDILLESNDDLRKKFKIDEYSACGRHTVEELKKCKEMKSEFEQKKKHLVRDIGQVKKNTEQMNQQIDKIISDQEERRKQYEAHLVENSEFQTRFEHFMTNIKEVNDKYKEEGLRKCQASLNKDFELQARIVENVETRYQQLDKIMSEQKRLKLYEACYLAKTSQLQGRLASTSGNDEIGDQIPCKTVTEQERRKLFEACLAKNSELQAKFSHIIKDFDLPISNFSEK